MQTDISRSAASGAVAEGVAYANPSQRSLDPAVEISDLRDLEQGRSRVDLLESAGSTRSSIINSRRDNPFLSGDEEEHSAIDDPFGDESNLRARDSVPSPSFGSSMRAHYGSSSFPTSPEESTSYNHGPIRETGIQRNNPTTLEEVGYERSVQNGTIHSDQGSTLVNFNTLPSPTNPSEMNISLENPSLPPQAHIAHPNHGPIDIQQLFENREFEDRLLHLIMRRMDPPSHQTGFRLSSAPDESPPSYPHSEV